MMEDAHAVNTWPEVAEDKLADDVPGSQAGDVELALDNRSINKKTQTKKNKPWHFVT